MENHSTKTRSFIWRNPATDTAGGSMLLRTFYGCPDKQSIIQEVYFYFMNIHHPRVGVMWLITESLMMSLRCSLGSWNTTGKKLSLIDGVCGFWRCALAFKVPVSTGSRCQFTWQRFLARDPLWYSELMLGVHSEGCGVGKRYILSLHINNYMPNSSSRSTVIIS